MATKIERANKTEVTKQAIVLPADDSIVLDNGANVGAAPQLKGGLLGVITEAGKSKDKAITALHSIALALLFGEAIDVNAITFPRSLKNEKVYIGKIALYAATNGAKALRHAWNTKVVTGKRNVPVSLSGLVSAIKAIDAPVNEAPQTSASKTVGNSASDEKIHVDAMATLALIVETMASSISDAEKVRKVKAMKFYADATIARLSAETKAREALVVEPSKKANKKANKKDAVSSILAPRPANATLHMATV